MEQLGYVDAVKLVVSLFFLSYASWSDFRKREVSNLVWLLYGPIGLALTLYSLPLLNDSFWLMMLGLSVTLTATLSVALFYLGMFGGADAKLLICLSLTMPWYPWWILSPTFPLLGFIQPLFPLSIFCNGVLAAACSVFYALTRNIAWKLRTKRSLFEGLEKVSHWKKLLTILSGYRVKIADLKEDSPLYPLEMIEVEGGKATRQLRVLTKAKEEPGVPVRRLREYLKKGFLPDEIWVTPGLPLILFITVGFVVALIFGDPLYYLILKLS